MKKILFCFLIFTQVAFAQKPKIAKVEQITTKTDGEFFTPQFSPDGNSVLTSSSNYKGLFLIELKSKKVKKITDQQGSGYEPCFSGDGSKVYFRSDEFVGGKKYSSLQEFDLKSNRMNQLEGKSRNLSSPRTINNKLHYTINGERKAKPIGSSSLKSAFSDRYASIEDLKLVVYTNGVKKELLPNGEGNYIWASLSPDQTKVLYNYMGKSTFVCDLNGKILAEVGRLNAPKWLNNDSVVGMNDKDDGDKVTSSDIILYSLSSNQQSNLTNTDGNIEMYPSPSPEGDKLVFQSPDGELFIMYLNTK